MEIIFDSCGKKNRNNLRIKIDDKRLKSHSSLWGSLLSIKTRNKTKSEKNLKWVSSFTSRDFSLRLCIWLQSANCFMQWTLIGTWIFLTHQESLKCFAMVMEVALVSLPTGAWLVYWKKLETRKTSSRLTCLFHFLAFSDTFLRTETWICWML